MSETGMQRAERLYRLQEKVDAAEKGVVRAAIYFETYPFRPRGNDRLERAVDRLLRARRALKRGSQR